MSKYETKRRYKSGEIFMQEAMQSLVFDHDMTFGKARTYLDS